MEKWLVVGAAYLSGSIPFGLVISRVLGGVDVRRYGSGNIGTANVLRTVGKTAAALTLVGDMLKGFLPVFAATYMGVGEPLLLLTGLAAIAGHNWSLFLRFSGGKGVATGFGVLLGIFPVEALIGASVWILVVLLSRYTSLGALASAAVILILVLFRDGPSPRFLFLCLVALFIIFTHRENIKRLLQGTERKVGQRVR